MSNIIEWPKFNIRKKEDEPTPTKVVCCMNCHQAFFNIIVDDAADDITIECAMCGTELESGPDTEV